MPTLLLFVSGASGLIFEIIWMRALGLAFGTTVPALTTVLAAFMAGLALGNVTLGRRADSEANPLRFYARIELFIGLSAAAVSLLLLRGGPAMLLLARAAQAAGPASSAVRATVFFAILLLPATLMGGTLPVLTRALTQARAGGQVAGLGYAAITSGAVLGALLPDFWLIPHLGLTQTALLAALGNFAVALVAGRLRLPVEPQPPSPAPGPVAAAPLWLFAISGFCAMGYEVLWSRLLHHLTDGLIASFSVLLAVYLLCVALGSRATARRADGSARPLWTAAVLLLASGAAICASLALLPRWVEAMRAFFPLEDGFFRRAPAQTWLIALCHSLYLEALPCFCMGAAFPYLAAGVARPGEAGRGVGRLGAVNLLAGVAGAVLTGFLFLPWLGMQRALLGLALLAVLVGGAAAVWLSRRGPRALGPAAAALGAIVLSALLPRGLLLSTVFLPAKADTLAVLEGTTTSVAVVVRRRFGQSVWRELHTPGVSMSDTSFSARRYMGMMAHLPAFFAPQAKSALLICYGVGNTARSLLSHPELERLDVVDISPEVIAQSPLFAHGPSEDPLLDPRTRVHVDDGRHFLAVTSERYDAITSEPPPPVFAGVVNLYTREYYAQARARLRPGGVLSQWLPIFQLTPEETLSIASAMAAEFAWVGLWYGQAAQLILLGSDRAPRLDGPAFAAFAAHARAPSLERDFARAGIAGVEDLFAGELQGDEGLRRLVAGIEPLSDDRPTLEYPTRALRAPVEVPPGLYGDPRALVSAGQARVGAETMAIVQNALSSLTLSPIEVHDLGAELLLRPALGLRPRHPSILGLLEIDDALVSAARTALRRDPGRVDAAVALARRSFFEADWTEACALLRPLGPAADARASLLRGGCARALGQAAEAAAAFRRAADQSADDGFRRYLRALAEQAGAPFVPASGPLSMGAF